MMMTYRWFKIFNLLEFEALGLVSRTFTLELEGIGQKDILVVKGIGFGLVYERIFLRLNMNGANPFEFEGHAVYQDEENDVYLGIAVDES